MKENPKATKKKKKNKNLIEKQTTEPRPNLIVHGGEGEVLLTDGGTEIKLKEDRGQKGLTGPPCSWEALPRLGRRMPGKQRKLKES